MTFCIYWASVIDTETLLKSLRCKVLAVILNKVVTEFPDQFINELGLMLVKLNFAIATTAARIHFLIQMLLFDLDVLMRLKQVSVRLQLREVEVLPHCRIATLANAGCHCERRVNIQLLVNIFIWLFWWWHPADVAARDHWDRVQPKVRLQLLWRLHLGMLAYFVRFYHLRAVSGTLLRNALSLVIRVLLLLVETRG